MNYLNKSIVHILFGLLLTFVSAAASAQISRRPTGGPRSRVATERQSYVPQQDKVSEKTSASAQGKVSEQSGVTRQEDVPQQNSVPWVQLKRNGASVAKPDTVVVAQLDTAYVVKVDTVYVTKPDTVYISRPDTTTVLLLDTTYVTYDTTYVIRVDTTYIVNRDSQPAPPPQQVQPVGPPLMSQADIMSAVQTGVEQGVQQGVQQALNSHGLSTVQIEPRPWYMKKWDELQKKRRINRVDRNLMRLVFIPKGQWMAGATFNYQEWDIDNLNLLVLKNMDFEAYSFSASPYVGYFVKNNIAVGGRYNYHRDHVYLGQFDLNLGEDFNISLEDLYYLGHTHEATGFVRTYMSLGRANIFGFFSEMRATYAYSVSKNRTGTGKDVEGSFDRAHTLQLTFCPGMTAFVTDFMAVEASIGVMGFKYSWKNQHTNHVEQGKSHSGGANFKFNLLSINIGMTFYL